MLLKLYDEMMYQLYWVNIVYYEPGSMSKDEATQNNCVP